MRLSGINGETVLIEVLHNKSGRVFRTLPLYAIYLILYTLFINAMRLWLNG